MTFLMLLLLWSFPFLIVKVEPCLWQLYLLRKWGKSKKLFCHENTNGVFVSADLGSGVSGPVLAHPVVYPAKVLGKTLGIETLFS